MVRRRWGRGRRRGVARFGRGRAGAGRRGGRERRARRWWWLSSPSSRLRAGPTRVSQVPCVENRAMRTRAPLECPQLDLLRPLSSRLLRHRTPQVVRVAASREVVCARIAVLGSPRHRFAPSLFHSQLTLTLTPTEPTLRHATMTTCQCTTVGNCNCPPGSCACQNCHGGADKRSQACSCVSTDAQGQETCACSSKADCKCGDSCACSSCGKQKKTCSCVSKDAQGTESCTCKGECKCAGNCGCSTCGTAKA
ncbi:hypothetical protein RTBOTA2_001510 [Rhodotorula toruloides]|nr:hypothetical protein RTBOTA2_001507 [Rhodotorula toruloides]KAK4332775.1 hypothetical protein RTBOTA2_001510 [Rhodotorula toruloides]